MPFGYQKLRAGAPAYNFISLVFVGSEFLERLLDCARPRNCGINWSAQYELHCAALPRMLKRAISIDTQSRRLFPARAFNPPPRPLLTCALLFRAITRVSGGIIPVTLRSSTVNAVQFIYQRDSQSLISRRILTRRVLQELFITIAFRCTVVRLAPIFLAIFLRA